MNKIILLSLLFLTSCFSDNQLTKKAEILAFFDLNGYFETEVKELVDVRNISKITEVNGKKEILKLDTLDFKNELKIFSNSDINKPSWTDKYSIDSVKTDQGKLSKLTYQSQDPKLKIKTLEVSFLEDNVSEISILKSSSSAISEVKETLTYNPKSGYKIERSQDITMSGKNDFKVEVKFERN